MSDLLAVGVADPTATAVAASEASGGGDDTGRVTEVKSWLASQFEAAGLEVPDFECTPQSIAHLHALASLSKAKTQAAGIVASDLRQKAAEYRAQSVRIREILENVGLAQETVAKCCFFLLKI
ncbi:hypothetical protein ACLOJK_010098 [Asimina triloba]